MCVCERERENRKGQEIDRRVCVYVCERERERERTETDKRAERDEKQIGECVYVCVCVRERDERQIGETSLYLPLCR